MHARYTVILYNHVTWASMAQSSEPVLFTCEVVSSILATRTYLKRVSQLSAKNRGFSPAAPVSFHREVDREGLNKNTCSWESKNDVIKIYNLSKETR